MSHLNGLDFYVSSFTEGPIGHTFLSFTFDNAPPLGISIERRPRASIVAPPVANFGTFAPIVFHSSVAGRRLAPASPSRAGSAFYLFSL